MDAHRVVRMCRLFSIAVLSLASPLAHANTDSPLDLSVVVDVTTIYEYEALPITVNLANNTDNEFPVHHAMFRLNRGVGTVIVVGPDHVTHVLRRPRFSVEVPDEGYQPVPAGETHVVSFLLSCTDGPARQPLFAMPGKYAITVEYEDRAIGTWISERSRYPDVLARSSQIVIEVHRAPITERQVMEHVRTLSAPIVLYEPATVPFHEATMGTLRRIASDKQSQIYANYARLSLASYHVARARAASVAPNYYDLEGDLIAARKSLDAIVTEEFTLSDRVPVVRAELEALEAQVP